MTHSDELIPQPPAGNPVHASAPRTTDVLGLRIVAALIDLAILTAMFVALAATIGEFELDAGEAYLEGGPALLFFTLVFLYYFGFEVATGRTVGKLLVGLQVVGNDGARPSAGHVALRTVLRAVDGLPVFYVVGFVVMLATGKRRLRLGDLAAGTVVVRAAPIRHRGLVTVLLAIGLVAGVVLPVASTSTASTTYRAHGVTFQYPAGWHDQSDRFSSPSDDQLWINSFGVNELDGVVVSAYALPTPITAENLNTIKPEIVTLIERQYEQHGGTMTQGPQEVVVAGLPGLRYHGTGVRGGHPIESTIVQAFDGATEYFINCTYTPAGADEIEPGCAQILNTFALGSASKHEAAQA